MPPPCVAAGREGLFLTKVKLSQSTDARNLAERSEHTTGQRHLGSWSETRSLGLLGSAVLGARSSWGSHAHPLASCFVSLALLVSRISSVYLSKWHNSWRV